MVLQSTAEAWQPQQRAGLPPDCHHDTGRSQVLSQGWFWLHGKRDDSLLPSILQEHPSKVPNSPSQALMLHQAAPEEQPGKLLPAAHQAGSTIPSPQTVHNCCYHVSQHSQQHFSKETRCTCVSFPPSLGLKAALAAATSPSLSISHEQPPKPPQSHH